MDKVENSKSSGMESSDDSSTYEDSSSDANLSSEENYDNDQHCNDQGIQCRQIFNKDGC